MASDPYTWVAHQAAIEVLVRLRATDRKAVIAQVVRIAVNPHAQGWDSFSLPNEAPFLLVPAGPRVLTLQVDDAVREVRLLAIE